MQLNKILGISLTDLLGIAMEFGSVMFTKDKSMLCVICKIILVILKTCYMLKKIVIFFLNYENNEQLSLVFQFVGIQMINSLAFVFRGIIFLYTVM